MSKFVINNIDSLNLVLDKVKSSDPASYEYLNRFFQAFLDNDNHLMQQISSQINELRSDIASGEIVVPGGSGGYGGLGVPVFVGDETPDINSNISYLWFKPLRKTEVEVPDGPEEPEIVTFNIDLNAEPKEDGWHIKIDDIYAAINNVVTSIEEAKEGDIIFQTFE